MKKAKRRHRRWKKRSLPTRRIRAGLKKFRQFWGIAPRRVRRLSRRGLPPGLVMVSLGRCPGLTVADKPRKSAKRARRIALRGATLASNSTGTRLFVLLSKPLPSPYKSGPLGYAVESEYIPTRAMENRGTHKKHRHWVHKHHDKGGRWPRVSYSKASRLLTYAPASYRVGEWIER